MSTSLAPFRIVLTLDPYRLEPAICSLQSQLPNARQGTAIRFELYLNSNGTALDDVSNISDIKARIVAKENISAILVGPVSMSGGLGIPPGGGGGYDNYFTKVDFTATQMMLDLTGGANNRKTFVVSFEATLTDASILPLGETELTVFRNGAANGAPVIGSNQQNSRISDALKFQIKNIDTGKYHSVWLEGADSAPVLKIAAGET